MVSRTEPHFAASAFMREQTPLPLPLLRASSFACRVDVRHGFTTRFDGSGDRLDLGRDATPQAWASAAAALAMPGASVARVHQVHGATVHRVEDGGVAGEGDGVLTTTPGVILAVRTADCVPVLLVLGTPAVAVAAVHAGWRGVAADILGVAVRALRKLDAAATIQAVIGPAISGSRYEVGEEVVDAIRATGVPVDAFVQRPAGAPRPFADVRAAARWQLQREGIHDIEQLPHCTYDDPSLWSHRRDGRTRGSLAALIGMVG
ncbi:MAG TPA: peptidoglycan editing factor PgeF [Deltaproteobacteria bacterium]|nr:peptidoglycan editing factor PgeF [Deltaproteobacteria bacterium]